MVGHHVFKILGSFDKHEVLSCKLKLSILTTNISFRLIHRWVGLIDVVIRAWIKGKDGTLFYSALDA